MVQHLQINQHDIYHMNKSKDKNHKIISIYAQKAFHKTQHSFIIKTLSKVDVE